MIELYEFAASGNCHKVRLLLSLLCCRIKACWLMVPKSSTNRPIFWR